MVQETGHVDQNLNTPIQTKQIVRVVTVTTIHSHPKFDPTTINGQTYSFLIWGEAKRANAFSQAKVRVYTSVDKTKDLPVTSTYDHGKNAWLLQLPIKDVASVEYNVECTYKF